MHNEKQWWSRLQVTFIIIERSLWCLDYTYYVYKTVNSTNTLSTEKKYRGGWKYPFISRSI